MTGVPGQGVPRVIQGLYRGYTRGVHLPAPCIWPAFRLFSAAGCGNRPSSVVREKREKRFFRKVHRVKRVALRTFLRFVAFCINQGGRSRPLLLLELVEVKAEKTEDAAEMAFLKTEN